MSVPGIDLENQEPEPRELAATDPNPAATEPEDDDEPEAAGRLETFGAPDGSRVPVVIGPRGERLIPAGLVSDWRKAAKTASKQLAELQPQVQRMAQVEQQIAEIRPYAEYIKQHPELIEQAASGTAPSRTTPQPEDDIEARDTAEDLGLYTADNKLDIARARRILDRATANAEKKLEKQLEPMRRQNAEGQAAQMRERLYGLKAKDGVTPIATRESLDEMAKVLPPDLLAQPNVAFFVALAAAGFDKFNGRTPQAAARAAEDEGYNDPLHTEAPGRRGTSLPPELSRMGKRFGVSEAQLKEVTQKFDPRQALELE